jgi:hypothetical protein
MSLRHAITLTAISVLWWFLGFLVMYAIARFLGERIERIVPERRGLDGCLGCLIGGPLFVAPMLATVAGIAIILFELTGRSASWFYFWLGVFFAGSVVTVLIVKWIWPRIPW